MILEHRFGHIAEDARRRRALIASLAPLFDATVEAQTVVPNTAFHRYNNLGAIVLAAYRTPPQVIERTASRTAAQGLDHIVLRTQVSGRVRVSADEARGEAGPGDVLVLDLSRPVRIEAEAVEGADLVVPRRLIADQAGDLPDWHGRVLHGGTDPVAHLLADHLQHLGRCASAGIPGQMTHIVSATIPLCKALFAEAGNGAWPPQARVVATDVAIRRFIEEHLADVDVPMLTTHFGLSRTPLYRLFAKDGGVCAYIRDRRLASAMRRLGRPGDRRPKVARLAHECGFRSDLMFSRAFRRKYGLNPSDVVPGRPDPASSCADDPLLRWLREL